METAQSNSFGTLLKRYRVAAGLSQEALAERAHMSVRGISDLERGVRRAPYKETLSQLIDALELPPEERAELEAASQRFRMTSRPRHEEREAYDPDSSLLETKLRLPPASSGLVPRARLVERLETGLRGPLTLVSAPTGCGKTTLIRAWRATPKGETALLAWVSLEPGDNDPVVFWNYVCTALDRVAPGTGKASLAMLRSTQPPNLTVIPTQLVNALSAVDGTVVLALDDYHVIESQTVHQGIAFLLDHLPSSLHLLIASRADPPLPLARLRARRQIIEIVADDLRFTRDEASAYLQDVMDLALSRHEIDDLEARTEGWIAGLQLAALSLQGRPPEVRADFIASFTGSHRHVVDYLTDEVLARQAGPVQAFLLRTAILDRLCASLCAYVMDGENTAEGTAASQRLLEDLERRHVFLVALDEERRWYRYHHLFRDALRNHLQQSAAEVVSDLHRRASDWYAEQGMVDEAVAHALRAEAFELAARLIDRVAWQRIFTLRLPTLQSWLDALPDSLLRTQPRLSAVRAFIAFQAGSEQQAEGHLRDAETALSGAPVDNVQSVGGEIEAVRALLAVARGDLSQAITRARDALDNLGRENVALRDLLSVMLSAAQLERGDLAGAAQSFGAEARRARSMGNVFTALAADVNLSFVQRAQGALHQAATTCQDGLSWAAEHRAVRIPPAGGLRMNLAGIFREWNDLDTALHHARQGNAVLQEAEHVDFNVFGLVGLARVVQAQGDLRNSLDLLETARALAERRQSTWSLALIGACEAQVWLAQGNLEAAIRWAENPRRQEVQRPASIAAVFVYTREYLSVAPLQILLARARMSGERAALYTCLAEIEQQRVEAERIGMRWMHVKMLVLEALAFQSLGDRDEAHRALTQAFVLAEQEGYVRVFADEGGALEPLLHELAETKNNTGHVGRVLTALPRR